MSRASSITVQNSSVKHVSNHLTVIDFCIRGPCHVVLVWSAVAFRSALTISSASHQLSMPRSDGVPSSCRAVPITGVRSDGSLRVSYPEPAKELANGLWNLCEQLQLVRAHPGDCKILFHAKDNCIMIRAVRIPPVHVAETSSMALGIRMEIVGSQPDAQLADPLGMALAAAAAPGGGAAPPPVAAKAGSLATAPTMLEECCIAATSMRGWFDMDGADGEAMSHLLQLVTPQISSTHAEVRRCHQNDWCF